MARSSHLSASLLLLVCAQPGQAAGRNELPDNSSVTVRQSSAAGPAATRPMTVQVRADQPLRVQTSANSGVGLLGAFIAALPALIALIGSLIVVSRSNRQSEKNSLAAINLAASSAQAAVNQKANEVEIARIEQRLADFFGPFMQLSAENKRLADVLRSRQHDPEFRTLRALLNAEWRKTASQTDLNLISRIVDNGRALRALIREKAGPVDPALAPYLGQAAAHFSILELAEAGALTDAPESFEAYVYPRPLDAVIELELRRLIDRRDLLLADLAVRPPQASPLVIPNGLALETAKGADAPP